MTRPLILAIEPDAQQVSQLNSVARRLDVELVVAESVESAFETFSAQLPDLILTPALLSRREDLALTDRLRELGETAAHVQTLTMPRLEAAEPPSPRGGMLAMLRRRKTSQAPLPESAADTFADQIALYLERAAEGRSVDPAVPAPAPATEALVEEPRVCADTADEILVPMLPPLVAHATEERAIGKRREDQPDDWSYFDPEQSRFAALITKLDEIAAAQT